LIDYLINDKNPSDVKVAMINALGWSSAISNADILLAALEKKYGNNQLKSYAPIDIMCYAYMSAMDDYFDVSDELDMMEAVVLASPASATSWMVWAMIKGQQMMDENWCAVWQAARTALVKSGDDRDIKTAAVQNIVDYMILYKEYCD
jgi:hypothetical protein